ncbi:MAG TPA: tetratricopeptide repeat protein [Bryobacteraceae bacterium]|nr:tetratricopeptide repeat protein [Bryobacteraceae bacterium]
MPRAARPLKFGLLTAAALAIVGAGALAQRTPENPPNEYVDGTLCAACHQEIAASFAKTGMGRSFFRLRPQNLVETLGKPYYHAASESWYEMTERNGEYFQRRWQIGFDGKETNVEEKRVDYVIGSGDHARTYAHLTPRNTLQELAMSWYSEKGGYWAMSPGYDRPDHPQSTRLISNPCMFCHNAYPKIPKAAEEPNAVPQFLQPLPEGIDCQRCHGPGRKHIETVGRPGATAAEIRDSIVNPKALSPDRELEVCMQCHLQTTALSLPHSLLRPGTGPFSYVAGQPMGSFRFTFDREDGQGEHFEIAHTAYRLRESQCFLQSAGKMTCTTCHDPHVADAPGTARARYNGICRNCHASELARIAEPAAAHTAAAADCVSCHMPKRRTDDVAHVVMTDHLIARRPSPGDLLADKPEERETAANAYHGEVVPYYPAKPGATDEEAALNAGIAQLHDGTNLKAGLPRMAALIEKYKPANAEYYTSLAEGYRAAGDLARALPVYEEAVRHAPNSEIVLRNLGGAQFDLGHLPDAEATLRRATSMAPDDPEAWGLLGETLWAQGKSAEGKAALTKGIEIDPEIADLHTTLATFLMKAGDPEGAEKEIREALRIQPANAAAQGNLGSLLAQRGADPEAIYHFKESVRLNPSAAAVRLNYARLLANLNQAAEAQTQLEAAIATDSKLAGAHELLGSLLGAKGDVDGALRELQIAVQLEPNSGSAQFKLGVAFGLKHDIPSAIEHLKLAAAGLDSQAKQSALDLLRQLGQ